MDNNEARLKIGRAITAIPEEYKEFFYKKNKKKTGEGENEIIGPEYDDKLKLILHVETKSKGVKENFNEDLVLLSEGRKDVHDFLGRLRVLLKWGHFMWRLSDLSALHLEATRVIPPVELEDSPGMVQNDVEMKVHWRLKVVKDEGLVYIDGKETKMNLKSLWLVQYHRLRDLLHNNPLGIGKTREMVIYTGISRYVFSARNGLCKEWHVERIEPKITGVDLKWRVPILE